MLLYLGDKIDRDIIVETVQMVSRLQVENSTGKGGATVVWIHGFIIVEQWDIAALLNSKEHLKQSEAPVTHVCKVSHPAVNQNSLRN